jgi:hypothetical protein
MYHKEVINEIEFVIIDNNPTSVYGKKVEGFSKCCKKIRYVPYTEKISTFVKYKVFELATTPYVLCMDCHVLLEQCSLRRLLNYYDKNPNTNDLLQGPLIYDDLSNISTHFEPVWRGGMYGIWATNEKGKNPNNEPFEIPMQGAGVLTCRKEAFVDINPLFKGFGGEEGYIHEKFKRKGGKVLCLPFLRWMHRFGRPGGTKYIVRWEDRLRNYFIGRLELGLDVTELKQHFLEKIKLPEATIENIYTEVVKEMTLKNDKNQ